MFAVDEDFGGSATGIVVARHAEAVGPGGKDRKQVAAFDRRQSPVFREEISGFANRPNYIDDLRATQSQILVSLGRNKFFADSNRPNEMECIIQRRTNQVIHSGIDYNEILLAALLEVQDLCY